MPSYTAFPLNSMRLMFRLALQLLVHSLGLDVSRAIMLPLERLTDQAGSPRLYQRRRTMCTLPHATALQGLGLDASSNWFQSDSRPQGTPYHPPGQQSTSRPIGHGGQTEQLETSSAAAVEYDRSAMQLCRIAFGSIALGPANPNAR
ncbi:MAG: hypothetical protein L6R40_008432 [Gallowayella cf. fulva]|nr:MAG: hypothetical protein L6R40_008432 [Xanthomendoza cf. fulva]